MITAQVDLDLHPDHQAAKLDREADVHLAWGYTRRAERLAHQAAALRDAVAVAGH